MAGTTTEDVEVFEISFILIKLFIQNIEWFVGDLGGSLAIFSMCSIVDFLSIIDSYSH